MSGLKLPDCWETLRAGFGSRNHHMNRISVWILLTLLFTGSACGPDQATQLLEIAQFEERQSNRVHAKELYEDIVNRYPDSPAAQTARARLTKLAEP